VVRGQFLKFGYLAQATGFIGASFSRAQHRAAGVEAAARRDVGRVGGFAAQHFVLATTPDLGCYGEQGLRVGVQGVGEDLPDRADLHDLTQVHDGDPIGYGPGEGEVVGDENERRPDIVLQFDE
jgi:hypothetical protein